MELNSIIKLIENVEWISFKSAYGNANPYIPTALKKLFSNDYESALEATHELWCGLCHQYTYVSSAALPGFEFLLLALEMLNDELKIEILDIMRGFAYCTDNNNEMSEWKYELREKLKTNIVIFENFSESKDELIKTFADDILQNLNN